MLQLPVKQPCRTEWPKWSPGVTKLNVILSVLQLSVVSGSLVLSIPCPLASVWAQQWNLSTTHHSSFNILSVGAIFWQSRHLLHLSVQTDLLLSFLLSSPAASVVLSLSSSLSPLLLFYFNLSWIDFFCCRWCWGFLSVFLFVKIDLFFFWLNFLLYLC